MESEYHMPGSGEFLVTPDIRKDYEKNGFIVVRDLFSHDETVKIKDCVEKSEDIKKYSYGREDSNGRMSKMCMWNYAGNDILGMVARSQKVAGTAQELMGGDEIYHYHSKLMMKEARTGGAWNWHQDYGYWYGNGCVLPEMASIFMAIDKCTVENGCLRILRGSHKTGRIEHSRVGDQAGIMDKPRLEAALKMFELIPVEMNPGDVLFFHCNLWHTSDKNDSDMRRYAIITSVNKRLNDPIIKHHCPNYHPLNMVDNSEILKCNRYNSTEEKGWANPDEDKSHAFLDKKK